MLFSPTITETLANAQAKALATNGPAGLNVVPVSMIRVRDDSIWLFDFFMDKTVVNIQAEPTVALTAWSNTTGIQVKGIADYQISGDEFDQAVTWVYQQNPERIVRGLISVSPIALFDISLGGAFSIAELSLV
jgi:predicted pyridoxine 5'-phosphate oxidase superfamily flavin-nucleotide-binding protein